MRREDGPAIRDTLIWFAALIVSGGLGCYFWGTWAAVPFFIIYGAIYGGSSDSRWHESGHGTAFKTDWMNNALYEIASFMGVECETRFSGVGAMPATTAIRLSWAANPGSRNSTAAVFFRVLGPFFFGLERGRSSSSARRSATAGPKLKRGRKGLHSRIGARQGRAPHPVASNFLIYAGLIAAFRSTRGSILPLCLILLPSFLRHVAPRVLRPYPTCGACRRRARPPAELPDGLHGARSTASCTGI